MVLKFHKIIWSVFFIPIHYYLPPNPPISPIPSFQNSCLLFLYYYKNPKFNKCRLQAHEYVVILWGKATYQQPFPKNGSYSSSSYQLLIVPPGGVEPQGRLPSPGRNVNWLVPVEILCRKLQLQWTDTFKQPSHVQKWACHSPTTIHQFFCIFCVLDGGKFT